MASPLPGTAPPQAHVEATDASHSFAGVGGWGALIRDLEFGGLHTDSGGAHNAGHRKCLSLAQWPAEPPGRTELGQPVRHGT